MSLGLDEHSTVVDLGCGTAGFAAAAAARCGRVVCVDVSAPMLEAARARRLPENVELVQAGFLGYEHKGEPADFVYSRNALHHLPDLWKAVALARIRSLLAAGGHVLLRDLVFSFDAIEADEALERWLASASLDPAHGWTRAELETHLATEFSTFTWLLEPMIERAGFEIVNRDYGRLGVYAAYLLSSPA